MKIFAIIKLLMTVSPLAGRAEQKARDRHYREHRLRATSPYRTSPVHTSKLHLHASFLFFQNISFSSSTILGSSAVFRTDLGIITAVRQNPHFMLTTDKYWLS